MRFSVYGFDFARLRNSSARAKQWTAALLLLLLGAVGAPAQTAKKITLDEALQLARDHNHALLATRTLLLQNQAQEITANLRPNPVLLGDAQFLPIFNPGQFSGTYLDQSAQFDLGIGYLFERGQKRQHRLQAARDVTSVTQAQISDAERTLALNVGQQFIAVLLAQANIELAQSDLASFLNTVEISEARYKAGDMSEGDLLKIKLQLLQFQMDVSAAKLAKAQMLISLRQLVGHESVPDDYDVAGELAYVPVHAGRESLQLQAMSLRPDLMAAQRAVIAAKSLNSLAIANGKKDVSSTFNYTHVASLSSASLFANIQLPIFDRNQGEIARTRYVITQAEETQREAAEQVVSDVGTSYEALKANDTIVQLYQAGYLKQAQDSRDISEYAYKRGAASLLDYLDAERSYRAIQLAYRQSLASYMLALEQLRGAVGTRSLP
jgi:cobalt-zinc-cadmium efflux system outer membrane protein